MKSTSCFFYCTYVLYSISNLLLIGALYTLTLCFRELGNFPQALRSINNALNLDARDVKALQVQGMLYYYSGQPELAEQSYKVSRPIVV